MLKMWNKKFIFFMNTSIVYHIFNILLFWQPIIIWLYLFSIIRKPFFQVFLSILFFSIFKISSCFSTLCFKGLSINYEIAKLDSINKVSKYPIYPLPRVPQKAHNLWTSPLPWKNDFPTRKKTLYLNKSFINKF